MVGSDSAQHTVQFSQHSLYSFHGDLSSLSCVSAVQLYSHLSHGVAVAQLGNAS